MAATHFSGPVVSAAGFTGAVTGNITGDITGNVTGNVTGDVTGNVTGDVTGNLTGNVTGNVTGDITGNMTGYRVGAASASQSTIAVAAGASNVCTVTIQVKDGAGTNLAKIVPFKLYASSAADGLTLASAASTGFAVASGGLSLANGTAVTTQISGVTSATGACVLSLTDTGKQTSYLVLVVDDGVKISAQLATGDYGA
jgi:hypothetical protein